MKKPRHYRWCWTIALVVGVGAGIGAWWGVDYYVSSIENNRTGILIELPIPDNGEDYLGLLAIKLDNREGLSKIESLLVKNRIDYAVSQHLAFDVAVARNQHPQGRAIIDSSSTEIKSHVLFVYKLTSK